MFKGLKQDAVLYTARMKNCVLKMSVSDVFLIIIKHRHPKFYKHSITFKVVIKVKYYVNYS